MWSKAEEKTMFARNQTCCTNSTEGATHGSIWKNKQSPTVFLHDGRNFKYWLVVRHNARCRSTTNNNFQKVLVISDGKQSFDLIVWIWRYSCRAWHRKPRYLTWILWLLPLLLVTWVLQCDYMKIKSHALITLSRILPWVQPALPYPSSKYCTQGPNEYCYVSCVHAHLKIVPYRLLVTYLDR